MTKRKIKFFSLILSLILITVSVPTSVISEENTDVQNDLSVTPPSDELVEQSSFEEITEVQGDLDVIVPNDELVYQEQINELTSTTTTSDSQLVTGVPDGIYAIEIATLSSYYLYYSTASTSAYASCNSITVSPTVMGMPAYLFSVARVPDTDRYIIRSIADSTKTLRVSGDYVIWVTIPEDDSQVAESNTFNITDNNGALLIKEVGTGKYICGGGGSLLAATDSLETQVLTSWRFRGYRSDIEDGVYSFKNVGNSGMWASTENDSYEAGAYIQKKAYDDCPIDSFARGGMFKINRIGDTNQYTIRLMTNNLLAWSVENSNIVVRDLPTNESEIPDSMKFYIAYDAGAYIIIPYIFNGIYMTPITTASDSDNLTISSTLTLANTARWKMYKYIGYPQHGIDIVDSEDFISNGAMVGQTYNFKAIYWSTDFNIHDYFVALPSQYVEDTNWNWNSSDKTGSLTVNAFENIGLYLGLYISSNGTTNIYITDPIMFYTIRQEETVYLQNSESEKYASVAGTLIPGGGDIGQYTYSDSSDLKWIVERDSNNIDYVRFKSLANGKYLGVDLSNATYIYQYDSKGDNTFWKIVSTESGASQIISKVYESSGKSLSIPTQSMLEGDVLMCYQYTNDDDYSDEWNLLGEVINVVIIYDQAYNNRYDGAYTRISEEFEILREKYLTEFGIIVNCTSISSFYSYADEYCSTDYATKCDHVDAGLCEDSTPLYGGNIILHEYHHTNIYNNILRIPFPDTSLEVKVAYLGHQFCIANTHLHFPYFGLAYPDIGLAAITNFSNVASETKTLIHEFGHFYGVIDHYGGTELSTEDIINETGNLGYSAYCIYGENKETDDVLENYTICEGCKSIIESNKSLYNHLRRLI